MVIEPQGRSAALQANEVLFQTPLSLSHALRFFRRWDPLLNNDCLGQFRGDEFHETTTGTEAVMIVVSRQAIPRCAVWGATAL